ncbi:hypothetical protein TNCV_3283791 [Trichonephila clavipes]|nr:hypothetical protein TNCV_3283791 [Trichonephila clavipes]
MCFRSYLKEVKKFRKNFDAATQDIEKLRRECDSREERLNTIAKQKSNLEVELNSKQGEIFALKVHEQMSRFGGLSEERPSVFKTRSKLGTHLSTQCSGDERRSRPCAAR